MDLRVVIEEKLATAISSAYESGNFSGAIVDAIHYLGDLIRSKSGLDLDGNQLVGSAFGGSNPVIRINPLQTDSDKEEQKGVEQMLRGVYTAIRNPRSHAKKQDNAETAQSIIILINFLIRTINKGRSPHDVDSIIGQVFDRHFARTEKYANLLVNEIPALKRFDVLMQVFQRRFEGSRESVGLFCNALLPKLTEGEQTEFWVAVSEDLKLADTDEEFKSIIEIAGEPNWTKLSEVTRVRAEHRLIKAIGEGRLNRKTGKCLDGALGTWAVAVAGMFTLNREYIAAIGSRLQSPDCDVRAYIYRFFFSQLRIMRAEPLDYVVHRLTELLSMHDQDTYEALGFIDSSFYADDKWAKALRKEYRGYTPPSSDDVPF